MWEKHFTECGEYLKEKRISGKNVLFLHTGGTPLFFDILPKLNEMEAKEREM